MAAMRVYGGGDLGWRLFDFSLLAAAAAGFTVVTRRAGWFAAVFAATLFVLVHGRDGLIDSGQRDLTMAVCLLLATALLFIVVKRKAAWAAVGFGLLSGIALTIKPTALPLSLAQLGIAAVALHRQSYAVTHQSSRPRRLLILALPAMLAAPVIAVLFLLQQHAFAAFLHGLRTVVPYYASLGHRPFSYLLTHSISPLTALVLPWLAVLALLWPRMDWQRALLACGAFFGLVSYIVQARGFPYYRYTLMAFLLPLMAIDLTQASLSLRNLHLGGTAPRLRLGIGLAVAALCLGGFFLGPQSAILTHRYRWWELDFISSLQANLNRLGGAALSGQIQCIDSVSGCGTTLYRMRLLPATGVLSDFLLFGPDTLPVVQETRQTLRTQFETRPPQVIVISSWWHMQYSNHYEKLDRWPWLEQFLAERYRLDTSWSPTRTNRWWSREETPSSYRIYVLRQPSP